MKRSEFHAIFYPELSKYIEYRKRPFNELCSIINEIYDSSNGHLLDDGEVKNTLEVYVKAIKTGKNYKKDQRAQRRKFL